MNYRYLFTLLLLVLAVEGFSQKSDNNNDVTIAKSDYRPQTSWPYLFSEFESAELHTDNDSIAAKELSFSRLYNVHLRGSLLHYVDPADKRVHLALISTAQCIMLHGKKYVFRDGKMMQLLERNGNVELLLHTDGNWQQLFRYQGAAYGIEMTASANEGLYNSDIVGLDRPLYEVLCQQRSDGREILLQDNYYIASAPTQYELQHGGAKVEKVSRKTFERMLSKQQAQKFRQFCKDDEINFRNGADIKKAFRQFTTISSTVSNEH